MMNELYLEGLTEEQNAEITAEVEADEARCYKNDVKSLARRRNQREEASSKNEGFFDKKGKEKPLVQYGRFFVAKPQARSFLKTKRNRAKRAEAKNEFKREYASGELDEDIAGSPV